MSGVLRCALCGATEEVEFALPSGAMCRIRTQKGFTWDEELACYTCASCGREAVKQLDGFGKPTKLNNRFKL
jgi:hypothetical protein